MRGICYGPMPRLSQAQLERREHLQDDFMSEAAKPLWGDRGRADLQIISQLGATVVRTYGNNPDNDHGGFLDLAASYGLQVIAGISNFPYLQMAGSCKSTGYNCFSQVLEAFRGNLQKGFLREDLSYHPALAHIVIINEPDLNMPGIWDPVAFSRTVISAADAMLEAERVVGVSGNLVNFSATVTFATCWNCTQQPGLVGIPAVRQMLEIRRAFHHPEEYGYTPSNDLTEFYRTRYTNSFNTHNYASEIRSFLDHYSREFQGTPVYVEEFHNPLIVGELAQASDLREALSIVEASPLMLGLSFFEFQVSYHKNDTFETSFGIFGLGDYKIATMTSFAESSAAECLTEASSVNRLSAVVSQLFGGSGVDLAQLCRAQPEKVLLTEAGFQEIYAKKNPFDMAVFIRRLVEHLGGNVLYDAGLEDFTAGYVYPGSLTAQEERQAAFAERLGGVESRRRNATLAGIVAELARRPRWASWDGYPACVADRKSDTATLGSVIQDVCTKMRWFSCANIPQECRASTWKTADYVLSAFQREREAVLAEPDMPPPQWSARHNPLDTCYYNGSAIYASSSYYDYTIKDQPCVISTDPLTTPLTDEGYQAVLSGHDAGRSAIFAERLVRERLRARLTSRRGLRSLFASPSTPPGSVAELSRLLIDMPWVCGGLSLRPCDPEAGSSLNPLLWLSRRSWMWITFASVAVGVIIMCLGSCCYSMYVSDEDTSEAWAKRNKQYLMQLQQDMFVADPAVLSSTGSRQTRTPSSAVASAGPWHQSLSMMPQLQATSVAPMQMVSSQRYLQVPTQAGVGQMVPAVALAR